MQASVAYLPLPTSYYPELEFRSYEDDAWCNARVIVDNGGGRLTVRYCHFPGDSVFEADEFDTWEKLEDFRSRFRQLSEQLQDFDCRCVREGTHVCASHAFTDHDVSFYDAVVEQVKRKKHSFVNGEEECLCSFMLLWQHGPNTGNLTEKKIESICIVQPSENLDPNVASFMKIAKERIEAAEEVQRLNNGVGNYYTILIENLETGLSPSTIIEFIRWWTSITVQAFVFPTLPFECCTRGVIVVNREKDFEDLSDFLNYPDHFIISSRGRPWVVAKNLARHDVFRASIGTLMFASQRKLQDGNLSINNELKVVRSGTEEYKTAKELTNLLVEFTTHQEGLHKSLAFEERKILRRSAPL